MNKKQGRFRLRRALFPAGYYASNSVYQGYISLYYTHLGFGSRQLGIIGAATAAAALAAQPLWGRLGDRTSSRRRLLAVLCAGAAFSLPLMLLNRSFYWQTAAAALFYAFFCALLPLGDTMLLAAEGSGGNFGAYRLAGGASFAAAGLAFGALRSRTAAGAAVWCTAALLACAALSALLLPDSAGEGRGRRPMRTLMKDRHLAGLLAFVLPLQMTMGFFYTFYAPHFKALGGGDALLGLGYLISTAAEAPYLIFSGRIYRRFGAEKPMIAASAVLALRWLLLGVAKSPWIALLSQLLHGGGFIVITVSMAYWIGEHVPEELRAAGQALLNMVTFGLARITGNLLGGFLAQAWGSGRVFIAGAAMCLAAGCCVFLTNYKKDR